MDPEEVVEEEDDSGDVTHDPIGMRGGDDSSDGDGTISRISEIGKTKSQIVRRSWEETEYYQNLLYINGYQSYVLDPDGYLIFIDITPDVGAILPLFGLACDYSHDIANPILEYFRKKQGLTPIEKRFIGFVVTGLGVGGFITTAIDLKKNPVDDMGMTGAFKLMGKIQASFGLIGSGIAVMVKSEPDLNDLKPVEIDAAKKMLEVERW